MKNAIILHGTGDSPDNFWFPYLKKELESRGYEVWLPHLPHPEKPNLKDWIPFILENGKITEETVIIGHSAGGRIILSLLGRIDVKIKQVLLVSAYAMELPKDIDAEMDKFEFNWEKIKPHAEKFVFINSDNDPWECTDKQGKKMFDNLGGMQIILHEGHMGSNHFNQPFKEFPLLVKLVELGELK